MDTIALNRKNQTKLNKHVGKIKTELKNGLVLNEKLKPVRKEKVDRRGVIYLGHIPHGFYEDEIRSYCSQFGRVTRVRVARSRKTGRSKGYAFVEFFHSEVAKIFAETINNYLMFNRLLSCHYIPTEKRHPKMFVNTITADRFPALKYKKLGLEKRNKIQTKSKEDEERQIYRRKIEDFKKFFEERGIEFNFKVNDPSCEECVVKDEIAVLEIDESDDEVEFNTPPHVQKVFKRSKPSAPAKSTTRQLKPVLNGKGKKLKNKENKPSKMPKGIKRNKGY